MSATHALEENTGRSWIMKSPVRWIEDCEETPQWAFPQSFIGHTLFTGYVESLVENDTVVPFAYLSCSLRMKLLFHPQNRNGRMDSFSGYSHFFQNFQNSLVCSCQRFLFENIKWLGFLMYYLVVKQCLFCVHSSLCGDWVWKTQPTCKTTEEFLPNPSKSYIIPLYFPAFWINLELTLESELPVNCHIAQCLGIPCS